MKLRFLTAAATLAAAIVLRQTGHVWLSVPFLLVGTWAGGTWLLYRWADRWIEHQYRKHGINPDTFTPYRDNDSAGDGR